MGEKRHAKKVVLLREGVDTNYKFEVFPGDMFPGKTFKDLLGDPITRDRSRLYRLRINGKWFPARRKILYTKSQLNETLINFVGE